MSNDRAGHGPALSGGLACSEASPAPVMTASSLAYPRRPRSTTAAHLKRTAAHRPPTDAQPLVAQLTAVMASEPPLSTCRQAFAAALARMGGSCAAEPIAIATGTGAGTATSTGATDGVTWSERAARLSEATQALLVEAVNTAANGERSQLTACATRFDSLAMALENDLLARSNSVGNPGAKRPSTAPHVTAALSQIARNLTDCQPPANKRPRRP